MMINHVKKNVLISCGPGFSNIIADGNEYNGGSIKENIPTSEENNRHRMKDQEIQTEFIENGAITDDVSIYNVDKKGCLYIVSTPRSADVQTLKIDGNVRMRLSTRSHDMVDTTMVHVLRIFDRFRNIRLNSVGSNYMSHADNRHRTEDQGIQTRSVENAAAITDEVSISNVDKRGCLHIVSTPRSIECSFTRSDESPLITASLEETLHLNAIRTQGDSPSYRDLGGCD
ncbi:hypothetical protein Tco_0327063 [Tanacetum coccineum]